MAKAARISLPVNTFISPAALELLCDGGGSGGGGGGSRFIVVVLLPQFNLIE